MTDDLQRQAHKVLTEARHTSNAVDNGQVDLALTMAKKVRRSSTLLLRQLAELRDSATAQEGTST